MSISDFRFTVGVTQFTSFAFLCLTTLGMLVVHLTFERFMASRKPHPFTPKIIKANNTLFGFFSLVIGIAIIVTAREAGRFDSLEAFWCTRPRPIGAYAFCFYIFYLSKTYEF